MVKLKRSRKHTYVQIHFAFKIPHCAYVLKMNLSQSVACFCSGFPGTSASSHPAPRVLRANKNVLGRLTIGKNCRTRNYLQYPGGSILESDVLKYWPFQLVKFCTHTLIFCDVHSSMTSEYMTVQWFRGKCSIVYGIGRDSKWVPGITNFF